MGSRALPRGPDLDLWFLEPLPSCQTLSRRHAQRRWCWTQARRSPGGFEGWEHRILARQWGGACEADLGSRDFPSMPLALATAAKAAPLLDPTAGQGPLPMDQVWGVAEANLRADSFALLLGDPSAPNSVFALGEENPWTDPRPIPPDHPGGPRSGAGGAGVKKLAVS